MKLKLFSLASLLLLSGFLFSQSIIGIYDFETVPIGSITPGTTPTFRSGNSASGDRPASSPFFISGDSSWGISNTNQTIDFSNVSLSGYTNCFLKFRLASWSIASTGNGADAADSVVVSISTDGGTTYSRELYINGNSNAWWGYTTGTGVAQITYDGNNSPTGFQPAGGAQRTTDGYSTIRIDIPNGNTQVRVRIKQHNNSTGERWTIDSLAVLGTVAGGSTSDLVAAGHEMENIPYVTKTGNSISATSDAHRIWRFTIRDGAGTADADALGTELNSLKIKKGNSDNTSGGLDSILRKVALFDGSTKIAEVSPTGDSIVFTGLSGSSVTAADNGNKDIDVYATFMSVINQDNKQIQLSISSSDVFSTGSQFMAFDTLNSGVGGDSNRIEVTADRLAFTNQPTQTSVSTAMSDVVVSARDTNGLIDLDFSQSLRLSSSGNLSGSPIIQAANNGVATFSGLTHLAVQPSLYLIAQRNATLDWNVASNSFNITGSANSDIVTDGSLSYSSNILYNNYQSMAPITNTGSGNVSVFRIKIRDGGAAANDLDTLPTTLNSITFANTVGLSNIRTAALFSGNTLVANNPAIQTASGSISFTGLNYPARDNTDTTLTLRVSFESSADSITDNQQLKFYIASAQVSASSAGSQFSTFSSDSSSTSGDRNRIEVIWDRPIFGTQPSDGSVGANLSAFTIRAADANECIDLDAGSMDSILLSTNGSGLSSSSAYYFTSGISTISDVQFNVPQNNIYIIAFNNSLSGDVDDTSNAFNIENIPNNSYRTISVGSGTWSTATWERFVSGSWGSSSAPATNTTDYVYIRHSISSGGSISPSNVIIESGATFTISGSSTIGNLLRVKTGGTAFLNASTTVSDSLQVDSLGTLTISYSASGTSPLWNGTEVFHPYSTFYIEEWNASATTPQLLNSTSPKTNYSYYGYDAPFGNITIALTVDPGGDWTLIEGGISQNLAHGDLRIVQSVSSRNIRMATSGIVVSGINGDFNIESGFTYNFNLKTSSDMTFTVGGNFSQAGGSFRLNTASASADTSQLIILGNMTLTGGSFSLNSTSGSATNILQLYGDLLISSSGLLTNVGSTTTSQFRFIGSGDGSSDALTQTIESGSAQAGENDRIDFMIANGAYVKIISTNWQLGNNAEIYVQSAGVLDMGFSGSTPLNITETGGTTSFTLESGGTLKITSSEGIDKDGSENVGNIRTDNRTYSSTGIYHYSGVASTIRLGDGVPTTSSGKTIIINTTDSSQVIFEGWNGVSNVSTGNISISGSGLLEIRKGSLLATNSADFIGSNGNLTMSGGIYNIKVDSVTSYANVATENGVVPQLGGTYTLSNGIIQLSGDSSIQRLRGGKTYHQIWVSGINLYQTDYKTVASAITINHSLTISDQAIFDSRNNGISGTGAVNMTGGRWRISKVTNTQPELTGSYSISGGTFELYGSGSGNDQTLRGTDGSSNNITWNNIDLRANFMNTSGGNVSPSASFTLQAGAALTVFKPCMLRLDASDVISGSGEFILNDSAGIYSANASGFNSNINTLTKTYSSYAVYGLYGALDQTVNFNFIEDTIATLLVNKQNSSALININGTALYIRDSLVLWTGKINTVPDSGLILMDESKVTGASDSSFVVTGNIKKYGNDAFVFPIGTIAEGYKPIGISGLDHGGDAFSATYSRNNPWTYTGNFPTGVHHISKCEYWQLNELVDAGSPTTIDVTLYFDLNSGCGLSSDSDYITDLSKLKVCHYNGNAWETYSTHFSSGNDNYGSITAQGVSSFSPFTFGSTEPDPVNSLPVNLIHFAGERNGQGQVVFYWKVACESEDVASYEIEKWDGQQWIGFGAVQNANGKCINTDYQWKSLQSISPGLFRLLEMSWNGKRDELATTSIKGNLERIFWSQHIWELPSEEFPLTFTLFDLQGKAIQSGNFGDELRIHGSGLYILTLKGKSYIETRKLYIPE